MNDWILHHIIENQSRYIREIIDYMLAYDNTDKADILKCSLIGMGIDNMLLAEQSGNFMLCNIMAKNLLLRMRQYKGLGIGIGIVLILMSDIFSYIFFIV